MSAQVDDAAPLLLERRGNLAVMDWELFENLIHKAEILGMYIDGVYPDTEEYTQMVEGIKKEVNALARRWEDTPG